MIINDSFISFKNSLLIIGSFVFLSNSLPFLIIINSRRQQGHFKLQLSSILIDNSNLNHRPGGTALEPKDEHQAFLPEGGEERGATGCCIDDVMMA